MVRPHAKILDMRTLYYQDQKMMPSIITGEPVCDVDEPEHNKAFMGKKKFKAREFFSDFFY